MLNATTVPMLAYGLIIGAVLLGCLAARYIPVGRLLLGLVVIALVVVVAVNLDAFFRGAPVKSAGPQVTSTPVPAGCPTTAPANDTDYVAMARQDACEAGIDPDIFGRQIKQESNYNPRALSPAGAQGIAQLMPATAHALGVDPWNAEQSLKAAAHLMASYLHTYDGDYAKALANYNAGPDVVARAIAKGGAQWRRWLPAETQTYIKIILQEG